MASLLMQLISEKKVLKTSQIQWKSHQICSIIIIDNQKSTCSPTQTNQTGKHIGSKKLGNSGLLPEEISAMSGSIPFYQKHHRHYDRDYRSKQMESKMSQYQASSSSSSRYVAGSSTSSRSRG